MRNLSKKKCLVYGYGIFEIFLCQRLAEEYKEVFFFSPWMEPFPTPWKQDIGKGISGITRVDSYEDTKAELIKDKGTFYFFDVGDGDKQLELRKLQKEGIDIGVFGSGESGELEMNRSLFKKTLKDCGLAVPEYATVTGIDALWNLLKKEKDIWIKLDVEMRGIMETFHHEDYVKSEWRIDKLAHELKYRRNTTNFMWERPIPGEEPGDDFFMARGILFPSGIFGYEEKGDGYSAKVSDYDDLPAAIKTVHKAMRPVERKYFTNGAISTEIRIGEDRIPYFIDACRRMGNPPAASISALYKNLPQICEAIAHGEIEEPEFNADYVSELPIDSNNADEEAVLLEVTEKDFKNIKLRTVCKMGDQFWHIPFKLNGKTVAKAVGLGKTLEESQFNALDAAENFKCPGKSYSEGTFDKINETIKKAQKFGLPKL